MPGHKQPGIRVSLALLSQCGMSHSSGSFNSGSGRGSDASRQLASAAPLAQAGVDLWDTPCAADRCNRCAACRPALQQRAWYRWELTSAHVLCSVSSVAPLSSNWPPGSRVTLCTHTSSGANQTAHQQTPLPTPPCKQRLPKRLPVARLQPVKPRAASPSQPASQPRNQHPPAHPV